MVHITPRAEKLADAIRAIEALGWTRKVDVPDSMIVFSRSIWRIGSAEPGEILVAKNGRPWNTYMVVVPQSGKNAGRELLHALKLKSGIPLFVERAIHTLKPFVRET
jgi:hypothetical protein